jgi:hypothetical protein
MRLWERDLRGDWDVPIADVLYVAGAGDEVLVGV